MTTDSLRASHTPSFNQVLRSLKRQETSLFNCLNSIAADTAFVREFVALFSQLPVVANLRCGLWYTPNPDATCYFKSTDGHYGNWSFSTTRLNWHIALTAAEKGGCIIVDATRRGKVFPDSLAKTVPIWAAVINQAVHRYREAKNVRANLPAARIEGADYHNAMPAKEQHCRTSEWRLATDEQETNSNVQLCSSCSSSQRAAKHSAEGDRSAESSCDSDNCHSSRQNGAEQQSDASRQMTDDWDTKMHLPPWISENERAHIHRRLASWVDDLLRAGVAIDSLAISLRKPLRPLWVSQSTRIWLNEIPDVEELAFTPLILLSASLPNSRQRHILAVSSQDRETQCSAFEYIPGAGDDEESWARGLTPSLFWNNHQALIYAGPQGIEQQAQQLITAPQSLQLAGFTQEILLGRWQQPGPSRAARDEHHPAIQGCVSRPLPLALHHPCFLGDTGIALGNFSAGMPPQVWIHAEAVLNVGAIEHAGMTQTPCGKGARYLWLPIKSSKLERHGLEDALPSALTFISGHISRGNRVMVHCHEGTDQSVCVALATLLCCFSEPLDNGSCVMGRPYASRPLPAEITSKASRSGRDSSTAANKQASGAVRDLACTVGLPCSAKLKKETLRRRLAFISMHYPAACPSRGNLKQVFSFVRLQIPFAGVEQ